MKQFIAFVRKEFFHIFRDRRTMLILLGMPVVQIILFGFAITTEVKNVRVAILDPSNDVVTRRIIDRLDASEYFSVTTNLNTPDEVEKSFRRGDIDLAVIFSKQKRMVIVVFYRQAYGIRFKKEKAMPEAS